MQPRVIVEVVRGRLAGQVLPALHSVAGPVSLHARVDLEAAAGLEEEILGLSLQWGRLSVVELVQDVFHRDLLPVSADDVAVLPVGEDADDGHVHLVMNIVRCELKQLKLKAQLSQILFDDNKEAQLLVELGQAVSVNTGASPCWKCLEILVIYYESQPSGL